jgi:hypothetical protein
MRQNENETVTVLESLRTLVAAMNPVRIWEVLQEADEGICLMQPVRIKSNRRR